MLTILVLVGCASPTVDLQAPADSPFPTDPSVFPTGTALPKEINPGSPVIIEPPGHPNSSPTQENIMSPASVEQSEQVRLATEDLMQRLNISPEEISLVEITDVVWSDGSLGCPQPGMFYTQALVEGTRIRLQVGEAIYNYHSGRNQAPFLCENPSGETGVPGFEVTE